MPIDLASLEKEHNLPAGLLYAVMQAESAGDPTAVSPKGATGLFQFMPATAKAYGIDPLDPEQSAKGAATMFSDLNKQYDGDLDKMLAAYNWGSGNIAKYGMEKAPKETRDYIAKISKTLNSTDFSDSPIIENKQYAANGAITTDAIVDAPEDDFEYERDLLKAKAQAALAIKNKQSEQEAKPIDNSLPMEADTSIPRTILDKSMQGATFGFADEAMDALGAAMASGYMKTRNALPEWLTGDKTPFYDDASFSDLHKSAREGSKERLAAQSKENPWTSGLSELAGGIGSGIAGGATKGGAALTNWLGKGGTMGRAGKAAAVGVPSAALYGAGQADDGKRIEGAIEEAPYGTISAALPIAGSIASKVKQTIAPNIDENLIDLAKTAMDKYNIPLRRSQLGDDRFNKVFASIAEKAPMSGGDISYKQQQRAFNKAIANSFGVDAETITGNTIKEGYEETGKLFDAALDGLSVKIDDVNLLDKLRDLQAETQFLSNDHAKIVNNYIDKFLEQANDSGWVPANKLGSFRSQLTKAIERTNNDAKPYLKDLRDAVVDTSVAGDVARKEMLNEARMKYKNLKTIEPLAEKADGGNISPALLLNPARKSFKGTFSRGGSSDLEELARIGQAFLKEKIANSGTAERLQAMGYLNAPALMLTAPAGIPAMVGGALTSGAAANAFNRFNRNQNMLKKALDSTSKGASKTNSAKYASPLRALINTQLLEEDE